MRRMGIKIMKEQKESRKEKVGKTTKDEKFSIFKEISILWKVEIGESMLYNNTTIVLISNGPIYLNLLINLIVDSVRYPFRQV